MKYIKTFEQLEMNIVNEKRSEDEKEIVKQLLVLYGIEDATGNEITLPHRSDFRLLDRKKADSLIKKLEGEIPEWWYKEGKGKHVKSDWNKDDI